MGGCKMIEISGREGFLLAVDGPNGAGKSTLIEAVKRKIELEGYTVCITREPTDTELGSFIRKFAESHSGISLACLVAADRYEHVFNEIIPELKKGTLVITDRYILSSLILQEMDGVSDKFVLNLNSEIIKPNLQLAVFADEKVLQKRLSERGILTRFEKGNQSNSELYYMEIGIKELKKRNVNVMRIDNNGNLEANVEKVVSYIMNNWRKA
ncbi:MAG: dTMP kinase [Lachnospiraceae bacterium]|nr:dTMP kinase [Lachnospiraceae bacterium]